MYRTVPDSPPGTVETRLYAPVVVQSFGYLHEDGVPYDVTAGQPRFIADVRDMFRDPHHDPAMRERTGKDEAIRARVLDQPGAIDYIADKVCGLAAAGPAWRTIRVAVGCAGGRHRSVVIADEIGRLVLQHGIGVEIEHLHIDQPVIDRAQNRTVSAS